MCRTSTNEWAGAQPWSNGRVGVDGISHYAMNQWQAGKEVTFIGSNDPRTPVGLGWLRASHRKFDAERGLSDARRQAISPHRRRRPARFGFPLP
jgi:hypothetical protein